MRFHSCRPYIEHLPTLWYVASVSAYSRSREWFWLCTTATYSGTRSPWTSTTDGQRQCLALKRERVASPLHRKQLKSERFASPLHRKQLKSERVAFPLHRKQLKSERVAFPLHRKQQKSERVAFPLHRKQLKSERVAFPLHRKQQKSERVASPLHRKQLKTERLASPLHRKQLKSERVAFPLHRKQLKSERVASPLHRKQLKSERVAFPLHRKQLKSERVAFPLHRKQLKSESVAFPLHRKQLKSERVAFPLHRKQLKSERLAFPLHRKQLKSERLTFPHRQLVWGSVRHWRLPNSQRHASLDAVFGVNGNLANMQSTSCQPGNCYMLQRSALESPEHTQLHQLRFFQQQCLPAEIPEGRQTARLHQLLVNHQQHLAAENLKLTTSSSSQSAAVSTSWNTWRETDSTTVNQQQCLPAEIPEGRQTRLQSISSSVYQLKYLKGDRLDYSQSAAASTSWNTWRETDSTTVNQQQCLPAEIPEGRQTRLRSISSSVYQLK